MKLTWIAPLVVMDLVLSAIGCGDGQPGITPLPNPTTILAPTPVSASDGTGISFVHTPWPFSGGLPEIYVVNAGGSDRTNLTNDPAEDWNPSWGPTAQRSSFTPNGTGTTRSTSWMPTALARPGLPTIHMATRIHPGRRPYLKLSLSL